MSLLLLLISCLACFSESAKILGVFPSNGYSQFILASALMKSLVQNGHEVTVISPYSLKTAVPNYREIVVSGKNEADHDLFELEPLNVFTEMMLLYDHLGIRITEDLLETKDVKNLLHSNAEFDLVICEQFINEAHMGFAYHFKAPLIIFSSLGASEWTNPLVANPAPFSFVPNLFSGYTDNMNFLQRLRNTLISIFDLFYRNLVIFPKQNQILQKHFPGAPHVQELMHNVSLVLLNSNVAMNAPVPHVPNMIEIGGFHVAPKKLSKELQDYLDDARDGAIYFSMGSNLKSKDLTKEKIDAILRVFANMKQKVLWKFEDEHLPGKPSNVKIGKWLPQQDILAHPNVRVFISHGGLLSTTEAVYTGVPMIGIPIYGDQEMNVKTAVSCGYAIMLPFQELTEITFKRALDEIISNTSYRETAQRRSKILKDQPMKPIDTAVFWIEYILRHRGASHLRSTALNLTWYQYFLLDVCLFVIITILAMFSVLKFVAGKLFRSKVQNVPQKLKKR